MPEKKYWLVVAAHRILLGDRVTWEGPFKWTEAVMFAEENSRKLSGVNVNIVVRMREYLKPSGVPRVNYRIVNHAVQEEKD